MAQGKPAVTETEWKHFVRAFKAEMNVSGGAADARSAGGALARHQLIDRLLLRKRDPLPPVCASRATKGPQREPRVIAAATAENLVADGQDSVPHERCLWAYMTLVAQTPIRKECPMSAHLLIMYPHPKDKKEFDRAYREEHLP
jgi:hypothetical protein